MARKTTVAQAIVQCARNMSMVQGDHVQPYADDQIVGYLEGAHQFIVDECEWPDLTVRLVRTLDGTTGKIAVTISDPIDWKRVQRVYHESSPRPVPYMSVYTNPLIVTYPFGYRALTAAEDTGAAKYLIQVFPLTLTGQVQIEAIIDYDMSNPDTVIPIDWWLHVYHASWQLAADDGTNQIQIEKYKDLFNQRMDQLKRKVNSRPIALQPYQTQPQTWMEYDGTP